MAADSKKRILITGSNGQLGSEFRDLSPAFPDFEFIFTNRDSLPVTDKAVVDVFFENNPLDFCINCAAYTAVDKAESEKEEAMAGNAEAPALLADACAAHNVQYFHISTDYVFDGKGKEPYKTDATVNPVNYYGETKLAGEKAVQEKILLL